MLRVASPSTRLRKLTLLFQDRALPAGSVGHSMVLTLKPRMDSSATSLCSFTFPNCTGLNTVLFDHSFAGSHSSKQTLKGTLGNGRNIMGGDLAFGWGVTKNRYAETLRAEFPNDLFY